MQRFALDKSLSHPFSYLISAIFIREVLLTITLLWVALEKRLRKVMRITQVHTANSSQDSDSCPVLPVALVSTHGVTEPEKPPLHLASFLPLSVPLSPFIGRSRGKEKLTSSHPIQRNGLIVPDFATPTPVKGYSSSL